jgi:hypothetical protein
MNTEEIIVPLDVPPAMREAYRANYRKMTHGTGRLMLMAGATPSAASGRRWNNCPASGSRPACKFWV